MHWDGGYIQKKQLTGVEDTGMTSLKYMRPKTIEEAVSLLDKGLPLAGGTEITPRRRNVQAVIDLSGLGLDQLTVVDNSVSIGATTTLQSILETNELPQTLRDMCRLEAGWNTRNMATIGGTIKSADGRSPLVTGLLALDAEVHFQPNFERMVLDGFLDIRDQPQIIEKVEFGADVGLYYEQVARSPRDFPLVCAALSIPANLDGGDRVRVALGGYGQRPVVVIDDRSSVAQTARHAFTDAGDKWASAEYRSHVAEVLVNRILEKSLGQ